MTHISSHPPGTEDSYVSASPLYKMFGYLRLDDDHLNSKDEFRFFFLNNTGYKFEVETNNGQYKRVGCHLALFQLYPSFLNDEKKEKKQKYCAIAYDIVPYELHESAEKDLMGNGRIENARIEYIEDYINRGLPGSTRDKPKKKVILEQTCSFMKTESFKLIYPYYKNEKDLKGWIRKHVVDFETTKKLIFGCGSGENKIIQPDFQSFLKNCNSKNASQTTATKPPITSKTASK